MHQMTALPADTLLDREARLALAMDLADLGTFDFDLASHTFVFSDRATRIYGFVDGPVTWADWSARVHPDDIEALNQRLQDLSTGAIEETRSIVRFSTPDGGWRWISKRGRLTRDADGAPAHVGGVVADVTDQTLAEQRQQALLEAAQHRVKNVVAVIRSVATRTAETAEDLQTFSALFHGRLAAFARTHSALARTARAEVDLEEMIHEEFRGQAGADEAAIAVTGEAVMLDGPTAELLGLAIHELTTNAIRHGALSGEGGRVNLTWRRVARPENRLVLEWRETSPWTSPATDRFGFGRELIERALPYQLDATTDLTFSETGMACVIELPLRRSRVAG